MGLTDFDAFWQSYPRKVAKLAAIKAYAKARVIATADEILAGVEAYKRHKPDYCDYAHAASWLNAGRWMDEYDEPVLRQAFPDCTHTPRCNSKEWCRAVRMREEAS